MIRLTPNQLAVLRDLPGRGQEWGDYTIFVRQQSTIRSLERRGLAEVWETRHGEFMARQSYDGRKELAWRRACATTQKET